MANHAVLSPSSADRWMTCPGSVALSAGLADTSSGYADEGTAAHYLAATCLGNNDDAASFVGRSVYLLKDTITGEHFESFRPREEDHIGELGRIGIDDDMAEAVQVYLDLVRDVVKSTGGKLLIEVAVPLTHMTGEEDAFGTSDAVIVTEDEVIVIDLKFGRGVEVDAKENRQMLMYASGALQEWLLVNDIKRVRMMISQPRISHTPSEWDCDLAYLRYFELSVRESAALVFWGDGPHSAFSGEGWLNPSEDACRWCKAKPCAALDAFVEDSLGSDFDNLLVSPAPKVEVLDNEMLATKMACIDLIEMWCTAVRAKVESELLSGHEVPGYKLVQGRKGNRAWSSAEEAEATMKSMRLKVDEMYDFTLISPTTATKLLKDNPKKLARITPLIRQSEGKASVAPASDKREALVLTPSSNEFDDLTGGTDAKQ